MVRIFFHFLAVTYQIDVRTAKFLNKFVSGENSLCKLFDCAQACLKKLYFSYGNDIGSVPDLCHSPEKHFFECN